MLLSTIIVVINGKKLQDIIELNKIEDDKNIERFNDPEESNIDLSYYNGLLLIGMILFIIEFVFLFYTIKIAFSCSEKGPERFIHVFLAIFFTLPYALFSIIINKDCVKETFKIGNTLIPTSTPIPTPIPTSTPTSTTNFKF